MNDEKRVFYFDDPLEYLNSVFQDKQKKIPKFSLREWSRQIGYQNPSMLFQVLKGERKLKMDFAQKLATNLGLSGKSLQYFELLVLRKSSQSATEKFMFENMINSLRPSKLKELSKISLDVQAYASDWWHWSIHAMTALPDFRSDVSWIQKRLPFDLDKKSIKTILERLERLGLLKQNENGAFEFVRFSPGLDVLDKDLVVDVLKQYQSQFLEKTKRYFENSIKENGTFIIEPIALSRDGYVRAQNLLAETLSQIKSLSQLSPCEEVYQFGAQLFQLTIGKVKTHPVSQNETENEARPSLY